MCVFHDFELLRCYVQFSFWSLLNVWYWVTVCPTGMNKVVKLRYACRKERAKNHSLLSSLVGRFCSFLPMFMSAWTNSTSGCNRGAWANKHTDRSFQWLQCIGHKGKIENSEILKLLQSFQETVYQGPKPHVGPVGYISTAGLETCVGPVGYISTVGLEHLCGSSGLH